MRVLTRSAASRFDKRLVEQEQASARARWRGRWRRAGAGRRKARPAAVEQRLELQQLGGLGDAGSISALASPSCFSASPYCRRPSDADRARRSGTPWRCRAWPAAPLDTLAVDRDVPGGLSSSPAMMRSSVDLPQPDGPTKTTNSPSATSRSTPLMISTGPKRLVTFSRTRMPIRLSFVSSAGSQRPSIGARCSPRAC